MHVPSKRIYISHDVIFDENTYPFTNLPHHSQTPDSSLVPSLISSDQLADSAYTPLLLPNHGAGSGSSTRLEDLTVPADVSPDVEPCSPAEASPGSDLEVSASPHTPSSQSALPVLVNASPATTSAAPSQSHGHTMRTRLKDNICKPLHTELMVPSLMLLPRVP